MIIPLNGSPGVGKLAIAKALAVRIGAACWTILNVAFSLTDYRKRKIR